MKVSRWANVRGIGFFVIACVLFAGCSKTSSSTKSSLKAAKQARLGWNLKTLVGAYQDIGNTDPMWDKFATNALTEFARARCGVVDPGESWSEIISTNCEAAIQAGCNDPMVRYLYIRYAMSQTNSPEKFAEALCAVAKDMQKSSYPDIRKFYVATRAMSQLFDTYGTNDQTMPVAQEIAPLPGQDLMPIVQDKTPPPEEVYEVCDLGLMGLNGHPGDYARGYSFIEGPLFANWPNESTSWLLKGQAYIVMGWIARGSGYANTVTAEGAKTLSDDLAVAEQALNRAGN